MPDAELVAGLDRDRLLELAASLEHKAFKAATLARPNDPAEMKNTFAAVAKDNAQLAALCRVVAGAENVTDWTVEKAGTAYWVDWAGAAQAEPLRTLASALGAVAEGNP